MARAQLGGRRKERADSEVTADALEYAKRFPYLGDMRFVADASGKRVAVLISGEGFSRLMRDYWAIASAWNAKDDEFIDWEEAKEELRADGRLPAKS
jgi:hypothetical protein